MNNYVNGSFNPVLDGVFEIFRDLVCLSDIQLRVDEDVQVEEDLSSDCSCSKFVPLFYGRIL